MVSIHPDYHKKLKVMAKKNYRSIVGQLQYIIDKEMKDGNY
tara:strand:- start:519 stop:641 length:123 start_codon:yes stop_codon:yes gene_type:complete